MNKKNIYEDCKRKAKETINWVEEHPKEAFFIFASGVGAVKFVTKKVVKNVELKNSIKLIQCRHYDPRTGENWFSRRPLRSNEQLQLDKLYKSGYSKGEALSLLGLL